MTCDTPPETVPPLRPLLLRVPDAAAASEFIDTPFEAVPNVVLRFSVVVIIPMSYERA